MTHCENNTYWNNRIMKKDDTFGLYEVYYDVNDEPNCWMAEPLDLGGYESPEELKKALLCMVSDALNDKPVLDWDQNFYDYREDDDEPEAA